MRLLVAVAGLSWCGCVAADLTNRSVFAELTYGAQSPAPRPQVPFQLYAELQGDVAGPWDDPQAAAQCLASVSAAELQRLGEATAGARDVGAWARALWGALEPLRGRAECATGFSRDPAQLAWALGKSADTLTSYALLTWLEPARRADVYAAGAEALGRLARVLAATTPEHAAQNELPVLALSGGAANGAFTAGFLFELLASRGLALERLPAADRRALDQRSRFSSVVGTSVGALLAQLLELAMVDDTRLDDAQRRFVDDCRALPVGNEPAHADLSGGRADCFSGWPARPFPAVPALPTNPVMSCALKLMQRSFADVDETDLMCAEPGSVLRSVGLLGPARTNFIRFDPLQRDPIDPVLDLFHAPMHTNGMIRVVMSTETTQNQLLGFDERACPPGGDDAKCLGAGLMASLVLPVFARPVSHAWSGWADGGECGEWVDGGLRSQLPALRALVRSRPTPLLSVPAASPLRVLALDTGRLTPLPSAPPTIFVQPVLNSLEQYATQQDLTELAFAQRLAELRDDEVRALVQQQRGPSDFARRAARPGAEDPRVDGVYVPADVPEWVVVGAGYSFDRYVMRGLFVWGQQVARLRLGASPSLASKLGWPTPLVDEVRRVVAERSTDAAFQAWLADYSKPVCPAFATWLQDQGARRIKTSVQLCVEPAEGPPYFHCPSGAWNPGGVR